MSEAEIRYTDKDTGTVFVWHGGAYIDVGYMDGAPDVDGDISDRFHAEDAINVWNDELDESWLETHVEVRRMAGGYVKRPFRDILEAFERKCQEYIRTNGFAEDDPEGQYS